MKSFLTLGLIAASFGLYAQDAIKGGPQMELETPVIDYGTIEHKADGQREFVFTNTGDAPLIISNARGLVDVRFLPGQKQPIAPGATGKLVLNMTQIELVITKTITLTTNTVQKK